MNKEKAKTLADYIPLVILTIFASILMWRYFNNEIGLLWKHVVGLLILPINYFLFWWRHKIGVLGLGFTILLGLLSILSYSHSITTSTLSFGSGDNSVPFFYGQPIFLLWLLIHLIISGRHYFAIGTKKYWQDIQLSIMRKSSK